MNKALVIGGSGFIGRNLEFVNSFQKEKLQLYGFVHNEIFRLNQVDEIRQFVKKNHIPTVISLAWNLQGDYQHNPQNFQVAEDTLTLYRALEGIANSFISIGTFFEIMGHIDGSESPYTESKRRLTSGLLEFFSYNYHSINLRIGFPYGPWDRETRLIPYLLTSLKRNSIPKLKNPDVRLPLVHSFDVASKILSLAQDQNHDSNLVIDYFGESFLTVSQIYSRMEELYLMIKSGIQVQAPNLEQSLQDSTYIETESGFLDLMFREDMI